MLYTSHYVNEKIYCTFTRRKQSKYFFKSNKLCAEIRKTSRRYPYNNIIIIRTINYDLRSYIRFWNKYIVSGTLEFFNKTDGYILFCVFVWCAVCEEEEVWRFLRAFVKSKVLITLYNAKCVVGELENIRRVLESPKLFKNCVLLS